MTTLMAAGQTTTNRAWLAGLCATALSSTAVAEIETTVYGTVTTDYVWRGITQSDDDPALQLGVDVAAGGGFFAGVWASTVDIDGLGATSRRREVQYYAGYAVSLGERLSASGSAVRIVYPGSSGTFDYDYTEYTLSLNVDDRIWLDYAFAPELFDTGAETHNVELQASWPLGEALSVGAGLGVYRADGLPRGDYAYWDLGLTRLAGPVTLDLRYHEADGWLSFSGSERRSGSRVVVSVDYVF